MRLCQLEVGSSDLVGLVTELVLVKLPHLGQEVDSCVEILQSLMHMRHGHIDQTVRMVVFTHDLPIHLKRLLKKGEGVLEVSCLHVASSWLDFKEAYFPNRVRICEWNCLVSSSFEKRLPFSLRAVVR